MNTMNAVPMQDKLTAVIQRRSPNAIAAVGQLAKQQQEMRDFIVPSQDLFFDAFHDDDGQGAEPQLLPIEMSFADISRGTGIVGPMHENAILQLAGRMEIPQAYARKLSQGDLLWKRKLLAYTFRRHVEQEKARNLLVRTVGGQMRAILSDKYLRMNAAPVFLGFVDQAKQQGAVLYDGTCGELNAYLEVVMPYPSEIITPNNGIVHVAYGAQISTSDFGNGSLSVSGFSMQVICGNGTVIKSKNDEVSLNKVHLGKRLSADLVLSEETVRLDTQAFTSLTKDMVKHVLNPGYFEQERTRILTASSTEIDIKKELKELPKIGLTIAETEQIEKFLLENDPNRGVEGRPTVWKLQQAITAAAQLYDPIRMREMQLIAGKI